MQVGNRSKLALELAIGDKYDNSQLFMYVAGCKFGDEDDLYDYRRVVRNVINSYRKSNLTLDYLYDCPGEIVIDAVRMYAKWNFEYMQEDIDQPQEDFDHKILASYPQFLDIADDLDTCVFRFVPYAFDNSLVLTIPFKNSLRICISEDVSERYAETSTTFEEFYGLWDQLSSRIEEEHPII